MREFREDLTGYDHLKQLLSVAWVHFIPGQFRFGQPDNDAAARLVTSGISWRHACVPCVPHEGHGPGPR